MAEPSKNNTKINKKDNKDLQWKIEESKRILKLAYDKFGDKMAIFWTGGKDSTVLLHMARDIFGTRLKFPILFLDTGIDERVYDFIDRVKKMWNLNLITVKPSEKLIAEHNKQKRKKNRTTFENMMKIILLNQAVTTHKLPSLVIGIRWDEYKEKTDEKYFSEREDHLRIHPLLHWTEKDIWSYIKKFDVPYASLYDLGYRSLKEKELTKPAKSGEDETLGREKDREAIMKRLQDLGYF